MNKFQDPGISFFTRIDTEYKIKKLVGAESDFKLNPMKIEVTLTPTHKLAGVSWLADIAT